MHTAHTRYSEGVHFVIVEVRIRGVFSYSTNRFLRSTARTRVGENMNWSEEVELREARIKR